MSAVNGRYPIIMNKKISLFLLVLSLVLVSIYFGFNLSYITVKTFQSDELNFDSRSPQAELSAVKEINETQESNQQEININFRMKVYSMGEFGNVFQTAELNSGIRLELIKPNTLLLIIANAGHEKGIELTKSLELNKWYSIAITINQSGRIKVFVDGAMTAHALLNSTNYKIQGIAVGTGFSKSRPFDGKVENFSISYKLYKKQKRAILNLYYLVFLGGILPLLLYVLFKVHRLIVKPLINIFCGLSMNIKNVQINREEKIKYVVTIITIGFVAITFFFYYRGMFLGLAFPQNTFLPGPVTRFGDLFLTLDQWTRLSFNGVGFGLSYFPSTYLIVDVISKIDTGMLAAGILLIVLFSFLGIYTYSNLKTGQKIESIQNAFVCTFMTYPVLFTAHTANLEAFVFIFLCLFVFFYQREKIFLSTVFLSMAISMKLFPAVFLVILIADKKYKELLYIFAGVVIFTLLPLLIFEGGLSNGLDSYLRNLMASQQMYKDLMIISGTGNYFGHSLLNGIRIVMDVHFPPMEKIMKLYLGFAMVVFVVLSIYIILIEKVFWKRVALLVIAMCLLPYTSTDYKLMHLFIPLFLFINQKMPNEQDKTGSFDLLYILSFSLLLIPKNYYYFYENPFLSINNVLNTILMFAIGATIVGSNIGKIKTVLQSATRNIGGINSTQDDGRQ